MKSASGCVFLPSCVHRSDQISEEDGVSVCLIKKLLPKRALLNCDLMKKPWIESGEVWTLSRKRAAEKTFFKNLKPNLARNGRFTSLRFAAKTRTTTKTAWDLHSSTHPHLHFLPTRLKGTIIWIVNFKRQSMQSVEIICDRLKIDEQVFIVWAQCVCTYG